MTTFSKIFKFQIPSFLNTLKKRGQSPSFMFVGINILLNEDHFLVAVLLTDFY
jgi:hypothetical protein